MSHQGKQLHLSYLTSPPSGFADSLTKVTARNLLTGREVPLVISHKDAFDDYLDAVIGELLVLRELQVVTSRTGCYRVTNIAKSTSYRLFVL